MPTSQTVEPSAPVVPTTEAKGVDVVHVTQYQFEQIEAAWRICSGGTRRVTGEWVARFDRAVSEVLGFIPPPNFRLHPEGGAKSQGATVGGAK